MRRNRRREPEAALSRQASDSDSRLLVQSGLASRTRLPTFRRVATGREAREAAAENVAEALEDDGRGWQRLPVEPLRDREISIVFFFLMYRKKKL